MRNDNRSNVFFYCNQVKREIIKITFRKVTALPKAIFYLIFPINFNKNIFFEFTLFFKNVIAVLLKNEFKFNIT